MHTQQDDNTLLGRYTGTRGALFGLAVSTSFLTLLTLGIYRFWARTRIRRFVWSATAPGGDPFEYTGNGLEKLLGFLISVVGLGVVLGIIQVGLFFIGMSVFSGSSTEVELYMQLALAQSSLIVLIPLLFFAQYRARRYKLSRTRWRGLRFGADAAATGYVWRALGHSLLTILTLGLLAPRQTYYLSKYKIDRTWYGDAKFELGGHWRDLYPAMNQFFLALAVSIGAVIALILEAPGIAIFIAFVAYVWFLVGFAHYQVTSFKILTGKTSLGGDITFRATPTTGEIVMTIIFGSLIVGLIGALVSLVVVGVFVGIGIGSGMSVQTLQSGYVEGIVTVALTLILMVIYGALSMVYITQPITKLIVESVTLENRDGLRRIRQRDEAEQVDADGFADALDVGGAF